ncbi:hypothetical protein FI667_g8566, partial [Globisporangium splendens]
MADQPVIPPEAALRKIEGATIVHWHLPTLLGGDDLLLTLDTGVEMRARYIDGVSVNGGPMRRFADFVARHAEWLQEPYCNRVDNGIGKVAAIDFGRHTGGMADHSHYDGQGSITLRGIG